MSHELDVQRCLHLLAQLSLELGWGLTLQTQQRYAEQIADTCEDVPRLSDSELCRILAYYHTDHQVVEALRDPTHPKHVAHWAAWTQQALRWLISRSAALPGIDEGAVSSEDLAQEALYDLWRGLPTYRYRSRFQTWAFTVIGNCLIRYHRALQTEKRGVSPQIQSLDALIATGKPLFDEVTPSPDEVALSNILDTLLRQVLKQHPDHRLTTIYQLWAYEEQPMRTIAEQLHLSATRVHSLLRRARTLLRDELTSQDWIILSLPTSEVAQGERESCGKWPSSTASAAMTKQIRERMSPCGQN
jgi:RNA polymerase sigma factor (sigma-70 family)